MFNSKSKSAAIERESATQERPQSRDAFGRQPAESHAASLQAQANSDTRFSQPTQSNPTATVVAGVDPETGLPLDVMRGVMTAARAMGDYHILQHRQRKLQGQVRELKQQTKILKNRTSIGDQAQSSTTNAQAQSCSDAFDPDHCPIAAIESQSRSSIHGEGMSDLPIKSCKAEMDYRVTEGHDALADVRRPWLQLEKMEGRVKKFPNSQTMAHHAGFIDAKVRAEEEKRQQEEVDESFLGQLAGIFGYKLEIEHPEVEEPEVVPFGLMSTLVPAQSSNK